MKKFNYYSSGQAVSKKIGAKVGTYFSRGKEREISTF